MIKQKILIVDDETAIIKLMEHAFLRAGYEVEFAQSDESAMALLQNEKIHVMFLDLNMSGINGIELCKKIRQDMPMAIIFAVTGDISLFDLAACREAGFEDYFKKPVKISTLLKAAENAFEKINRWNSKT